MLNEPIDFWLTFMPKFDKQIFIMNQNPGNVHFGTLLKFLKQYFYPLLITGILSLAAGFAIWLLMPNRYLSYAVVIPNRSTVLENVLHGEDFGFEIQTDWVMDVMTSQAVKDSIVQKFHLKERYEIDTTDERSLATLDDYYYDYIKIKKNRRNSIAVTVVDFNPDTAAAIANEIVRIASLVREELLNRNKKRALESITAEYTLKTKQFEDFLRTRGKMESVEDADSELPRMKKRRTRLSLEEELYYLEYERSYLEYMAAKDKYQKALQSVENAPPDVYLVSEAVPRYDKVSPKLSVILPLAFLGSEILMICLLMIVSSWKEARNQLED
jgi:capsular polysaccharide biosynthesis protein